MGILDRLFGSKKLLRAAEQGDITTVKALLTKCADVNVKYKDGVTALMAAAAKGHNEIVRLLKRAGANE